MGVRSTTVGRIGSAVLVAALLASCTQGATGGTEPSPSATGPASLACPPPDATLSVRAQRLWDAALTLADADRTDEAVEVAVEALSAGGGRLPAERCEDAAELLHPASRGTPLADFKKVVEDWLELWWAWAAVIAAVTFAIIGVLVRQPWWRRRRKRPALRIGSLDVDTAATGQDLGDRLASTIRSHLAGADKPNRLPSLRLAEPTDAEIERLPMDPVPEQVSWLVSAGRWLRGRNTLHMHVLLGEPDPRTRTVSCTVRLDEPTGRPVRRRGGVVPDGVREDLIEVPYTGPGPTTDDYTSLAGFAAVWLATEVADIRGTRGPFADRTGTWFWHAHRHFLLGIRATRHEDLGHARFQYLRALEAHRTAAEHDDGVLGRFFEAELNSAVVLGMTKNHALWPTGVRELEALAGALAHEREQLSGSADDHLRTRLDGLRLRAELNLVILRLNMLTRTWLVDGVGRDDAALRDLEGSLATLRATTEQSRAEDHLRRRVTLYAKALELGIAEVASGWGRTRGCGSDAGLTRATADLLDRLDALPTMMRPHVVYSLACVWARRYARRGLSGARRAAARDRAVELLGQAVTANPDLRRWAPEEPAFFRLTGHEPFQKVIAKPREKQAEVAEPA
ncbi:hypothetical protein [Georgenia muralis]|uniref:DUF5129 domain-containing protein n=1 Tax=Georgenia muralis TaxID=154117 RepID=A0A3N4ZTR5_9MICO|nr:hypothetical protein [Georgenia muralis]RPF28892.1 hypothetical protein EDD32_3442 [Georgenia muralis]